MKKLLLFLAVASFGVKGMAQAPFDKGDRKMDLTIGVGTIEYADKNRATFDQHFSMEWGVAKIADKVTVGLGFAINNQYGGSYESIAAGKYDYYYNHHSWGKVYSFSKDKWEKFDSNKRVHREGVGTADANVAREDVDALFTCSFHYSPLPKLDTYIKVGAGVGVMNYIISGHKNLKGFSSADYYNHDVSKYNDSYDSYSYNDLDHVKWNGYHAKLVPSMAAFAGATYYLTERWGADLQIGVIDANFKSKKKGYPNSFGVFAVGCTYKF